MNIGKHSQLIDALRHLIVLDFDAIVAYQAALDRIENIRYKRALQEFLTDHWRHMQELTRVVQELGGSAPACGGARSLLIKGKVLIGQLGGDRGLLAAMHSSEEEPNDWYENACTQLAAPPHVFEILQRARADERRHKNWLARELSLAPKMIATRPPVKSESHYHFLKVPIGQRSQIVPRS